MNRRPWSNLLGRRDRSRSQPNTAASDAQSEAIRVLRAKFQIALRTLDQPIVLFTSAIANEGKSSTCSRLAVSLARAGKRVVLIDADLRHDDSARWFPTDGGAGLTDVLNGDRHPEAPLRKVALGRDDGPHLLVMPSGRKVANPSELLESPHLARTFQALRRRADVTLVDAPPVLGLPDALQISNLVDAAVLVVASRSTSTSQVLAAKDALTRNQIRLLGVVLNRVDRRDVGTSAGLHYPYGYGASRVAET